jgi:ABC-type transport system substrate-binding protein
MSELWILSPKSKGWEGTIEQPVGTGPFRFGQWQPKVRLVAPRNEAYWQAGLPRLEAVHFDLREDVDKALALRAGDIHVATVARDVATQLKGNPDFVVGALKDSSWHFVSFNNRKPRKPFDDLRVRRAVMHAIDKQAFMRFVGGGDAVVTNQMVLPSNVHFDRALHEADPHAKPDLDKARALLGEAGVDPSTVTIELISWQESHPQIAVQMIRRLGFKVNHVALDDIGAQKRLGQYDWDVAVMSSGPRADVFLRYVRLMSDGPNPVLWGGVQDPEFDRLVNEAVAEPELEARKRHYLAAWRRVMDNYYTVVLGHVSEPLVWRKEVKGYEPGFTYAPHWARPPLAQCGA